MNITLILPLILGWLAGLFINYASDVLPVTHRFSRPVCKDCGSAYTWADFLALRACRSCGERRSLRTWLVQLLTTAAFGYFWVFPPKALGFALGMIVLVYFGILTVIDLEHRLACIPRRCCCSSSSSSGRRPTSGRWRSAAARITPGPAFPCCP